MNRSLFFIICSFMSFHLSYAGTEKGQDMYPESEIRQNLDSPETTDQNTPETNKLELKDISTRKAQAPFKTFSDKWSDYANDKQIEIDFPFMNGSESVTVEQTICTRSEIKVEYPSVIEKGMEGNFKIVIPANCFPKNSTNKNIIMTLRLSNNQLVRLRFMIESE